MAKVIYYVNEPGSRLEDDVKTLPGQNYQLISLSAHGTEAYPRFAAVWWPRPHGFKVTQRFLLGKGVSGVGRDEAKASFVPYMKQSYAPAIIAAIGTQPSSTTRFFFVFEEVVGLADALEDRGDTVDSPYWAELDMPLANFAARAEAIHAKKRIVRWACLHGPGSAPRVSFTIGANVRIGDVSPIAWSHELDDSAALISTKLPAYMQGGGSTRADCTIHSPREESAGSSVWNNEGL